MRDRIDAVHGGARAARRRRAQPTGWLTRRWLACRTATTCTALLAGRLNRLLLDAGRLDGAEVGRRLALVAHGRRHRARAAAWVEGFLAGGGLLLVHDERLLGAGRRWLAEHPADAFVDVLPLLRRTFGGYAGAASGERSANGRARPRRRPARRSRPATASRSTRPRGATGPGDRSPRLLRLARGQACTARARTDGR